MQLLAFGIDDLTLSFIVDGEALQPGDIVRHRMKDLVGFGLDRLRIGRCGCQSERNRKSASNGTNTFEASIVSTATSIFSSWVRQKRNTAPSIGPCWTVS